MKIIVVGSVNVDITAYSARFARDGETIFGDDIKFGPGGKGSNQATAAARAGGDVCMVAKIGKDVLSGVVNGHYDREGMSKKYISVSDTVSTGSAIIEVSAENGQNKIVVIPGANNELSKEDVTAAENEFESCDIFLTQLETTFEPIYEGIRLAKKYGKTVILNPAPYKEIPEDIMKEIDYFTPNETEAEFYSGVKIETDEDTEKAAKELIKRGIKNVIITLGKRGVYYSNGKESFFVGTKLLKAVDTTGAGDAFNGGLAVALGEKMDIETALKFANCAGSISVTRYGAATSGAYRYEIEEMMKDFYGIDLTK
ncbi:MAG: ribokinase [Ruminococcaceae bacterium]|nr:ribokinase [Oscillospiraceae bacterium]